MNWRFRKRSEAYIALATFNMCGDCPQTRKAVKDARAKVSAARARAKGTVDHFVEAHKKEGA